MPGVCSAGLNTTVLPVTSAAVTMPVGIASGKFQGAMTTPTPRGWYRYSFASPGGCSSGAPAPSSIARRP